MKLSKVKKVCMDTGTIVIKKAEMGMDIKTWIGTNSALYPVRGIDMNAALAVRIWEIEQKKLRDMQILEDCEGKEATTLIDREELESLDFLADTLTADNNEVPGLINIATINGYIMLLDREKNDAFVFKEDKLSPVEGERLLYIPINDSGRLVAIYSDGILEAVIIAMKWDKSEYIKGVISRIAEVCRTKERGVT